MRTRGASLLLFAVFVILAGCEPSGPPSPHDAAAPKPSGLHTGYFIQMPSKAGSPGEEVQGGAVINMTSNLPDGTLAFIT